MHEPFLVHLHQSFIDYRDVLNEMREAIESFESNKSGYVSQTYVEDDVVEGFDKVDSQVTELTDDANSIIENVEDLVSLKAIDASEVHKDVEDGEMDDKYSLSNFSPPDSDDYGEITYWDKRKVMGGNSPLAGTPDGLAGPAAFTFNVGTGAGKGAYDFTADTVKGLWNTIAHPIDTGKSLVHAVTHPMDTYNIFKDAIQTSYQRDMVDGDAESRTRWLTYAGGTIVTSVFGTKGADKVSKVGTTAAKTTVAPSKAALNNINRRTPNLFPLGPKYELAPVGPVPYNVIDSGNLKDQMIMTMKKNGPDNQLNLHTINKSTPEKVVNTLSNYSSKKMKFGRYEFLLDKKGMKHILERHHPEYWNGTVKGNQTFINSNLTPNDLDNIVHQVLKQNRETLLLKGTNGIYQVTGTVNSIKYVVGLNKGRVGQLYSK